MSVIPQSFIEMGRLEVDALVALLKAGPVPLTTEALALTLFDKKDLTDQEHRQVLSVMVAILVQQAAYT